MSRAVAIFGGIVVLAVFAGGLTEATLALGHSGRLSDDLHFRPKNLPVTTPTPAPSIAPASTPSPTPVATPIPTPVIAGPSAVTNSFVRLRAAKSTTSAILAELNGGTRVLLLTDADAQWQQVNYNGRVGYIFRTYLTY